MKGSLLSRRHVLLGAATCAATSAIPFDPRGAAAKAPMTNAPARTFTASSSATPRRP